MSEIPPPFAGVYYAIKHIETGKFIDNVARVKKGYITYGKVPKMWLTEKWAYEAYRDLPGIHRNRCIVVTCYLTTVDHKPVWERPAKAANVND